MESRDGKGETPGARHSEEADEADEAEKAGAQEDPGETEEKAGAQEKTRLAAPQPARQRLTCAGSRNPRFV
jgi:hypothetical protein